CMQGIEYPPWTF
nr:immunoglobulin light chain junction region [Macaca mulatta]